MRPTECDACGDRFFGSLLEKEARHELAKFGWRAAQALVDERLEEAHLEEQHETKMREVAP